MSHTGALSALCLSLAFSLPAAAGRTVTIDGGEGSGCSGVHMHFGDRITARGDETITLSRRDAKGLVLEGSRNGGITVRGADVSDFKITACTAAAGDDEASARAVLSRVALRSSDGHVTIEGPEGENWTGFLVVTAPKDADFSVEGSNGPVSLTGLAGTLSVKAANGPVSLSSLTGSVDVQAANGPVSLKGSSGDVKIRAVNGPLTITLSGTRWEGKGLEADAKNGPLTLKVPDGFSGVRVETSSHAPFSCRAAACEGARRQDGNRTRLVEIGTESAIVRISTANGPVSIVNANRS
jgi:DUF4097 and DUF4098 domain-containing protein YvlB